jgi:uncharacterized RDD family membrane protein YckC
VADYRTSSSAAAGGARLFVVRTPEQVFFRYELAGPVERLGAYLVDVGCMAALIASGATAMGGLLGPALFYVYVFLVQWGYFLWFEWRWDGATPGKRLMGIRVIQMGGVQCTFERLVLRNFLRVVDSLPFLYALGGGVALASRQGRRLGDLAAGTVCVRVPRALPPRAVAEIRTRFNSIRDDPAARGRVRQVLTPRESELVVALALRREVLDGEARVELFRRTAGYLRRRLRLSGHAGLPDERLVLNVASVVLEEKVL